MAPATPAKPVATNRSNTVTSTDTVATPDAGVLTWWREADARARSAFIAASLGWMLDSFDVMLYAIVLAALIEDPSLQLSFEVAGILGSVTLVSAAAGGIAFGVLADRI